MNIRAKNTCHPGNSVFNEVMRFPCLSPLLLGLALSSALPALAADDKAGPLAWPPLTAQTKPWCFWWWPGSAVDTTNLTRNMERYAAAGLGGLHIIPIYGARGAEASYIEYLSPQWMQMMGYTVAEAGRLGMGVDMTTGTGWCFGGPNVSDADANASVIVKIYDVAPNQPLTEKFDLHKTQALIAYLPDGNCLDLTDKIRTDGSVGWVADHHAWKVYAVSQKPSGQKVKRAAPGGEGWMLNLIYPDAVTRWLQRFTDAFATYTGPKPRAQFQDSYEYRSDWAPDFFDQFEKRRGYKLQYELPALFGGETNADTTRVKADYRETVSDIMATEALPRWVEWSHQHGFITRDQAHGSPGNLLDLYADADIPETEMFHLDRNKFVSKFASSASHVMGHQLTSAETGTWLAEHFTETLAEVKYLADDMFLSGINHIFYHGNCYSPDGAAWPGWVFYAATEMNPRNSIWHDVLTVNTYIARCQAVLQSGQPDNDVLLYWPINDFWMQPDGPLLPQFTVRSQTWLDSQPIGVTALKLWNLGYAFDYVSDLQLTKSQVVNGRVQMPGGSYRAIIVPTCTYMSLATLANLSLLAQSGATVIFDQQLPQDVPGFGNVDERRFELKRYCQTLATTARVGDLAALLASNSVPRESLVEAGLSFVRRSYGGGWNYFIANRGTKDFSGWVTLARPGDSAVILDPMTGQTGVAAFRKTAGQAEVYLNLPAGTSQIVRLVSEKTVAGPAWSCWQTNGAPAAITGNWRVKFIQGGPVLPADFQTDKLDSWTRLGDTNAQRFAGSALYTIHFDAPASSGGNNYYLDLGDVRQSARVRLNGRDYGTLIIPPFRVAVNNLKLTDNVLEVEITNVSANRIRDLDRRGVKWKIMRDINIVNLDYHPFNAADWPLTDSGLLGPVTLTPLTVAAQ
jgi:hypothetical protein